MHKERNSSMQWADLEEEFSFAADLLFLYLFYPLPSLTLSALTASSLGEGRALNIGLHRIWCKQDSDLET